MLLTAIAFTILQRTLVVLEGPQSVLAEATRSKTKELASLAAYAAAVLLAFVDERIAHALYVAVALIWLVPDRRIESLLDRGPRLDSGPSPE